MLLEKLKWDNHEVLGDLELDFCRYNQNGNMDGVYQNILLVGENGTGKSTVMETVAEFLTGGSFEPFQHIEYRRNGNQFKAKPYTKNQNVRPEFHQVEAPDRSIVDINAMRDTRRHQGSDWGHEYHIRVDGCIHSKARADFSTKPITTTKTETLDQFEHDQDQSDDFTSLKQLLVDIQHQDNAEFTRQSKNATAPINYHTDFEPTSKMSRFRGAFDEFLSPLKFHSVTQIGGAHEILFERGRQVIPIDQLSTGEKQIVFRGAYLLRNSGNLSEATILVDEPELSMHPKWAAKILSYYKGLFIDPKTKTQKAQMLFASHSIDVIQEALLSPDTDLVLILKRTGNTVCADRVRPGSILPKATAAQVAWEAFDKPTNDFHIQLYTHLQEKFGTAIAPLGVKALDTHIQDDTTHYVAAQHSHPTTHTRQNSTTHYDTICSFVRNEIHHPPAGGQRFTPAQLRTSIELMLKFV